MGMYVRLKTSMMIENITYPKDHEMEVVDHLFNPDGMEEIEKPKKKKASETPSTGGGKKK